jgi:type 1 glutamine amidotransferase
MTHDASSKSIFAGTVRKGLAVGLTTAALAAPSFGQANQAKPKVLDFYGVGGFAHGSRTAANTFLDSLAGAWGFELVKTEAATVMTPANLAQYAAVILNNSTESGKIFNADQRAALLAYMDKGAFLGMHGSGDTKGSWPDYTTYLGGELSSHGGGIAKLNIDPSDYAKTHPILKGLPVTTSFDEEWYAYKTNPRLATNVKVLYTLDEASCPGCTKMGGDHPVIWVKENPGKGRTFYYAMGHGDNIFKKNDFCKTVLANALAWTTYNVVHDPTVRIAAPIGKAGNLSMKAGTRSLTVEIPVQGTHKVEVATLSGKLVSRKSGTGSMSYEFGNLNASTVYSVTVITKDGRTSRLVAVP